MADRTLSSVQPLSWRAHSLDGTDDVGFDYQVQVIDGDQYRGIFRLQLKGTESPEVNGSEEFLSLDIKLSTLKYYEAVTEPILFVVCDLSQDKDPRKCPAYYVWIHEEVARFRDKKLKADQKSIAIRVPLANKLDLDFDVLPVLVEYRKFYESARELENSLMERMPGIDAAGRSALIEDVSQGISARSTAFVEAMTDTETYWPEAPAHTVAGQLTAANTALNRGHREEAEEQLRRAEAQMQDAPTVEIAAFWHLRGKANYAGSRDNDAYDAYVKACELAPSNPKYRISRIECEMVNRKHGSPDADIEDLLAEAQGIDTPQGKALAARLLALCGRASEARDLIATIRGPETVVDAAIVEAVGGGGSENVVEVCRAGLAYADLPILTQIQLRLILARTQLHAAVGIDPERQQTYLPAGGPPNLDVDRLTDAWNSFRIAIPLLRSTGWPRIIEVVADAWVLAALYTGEEKSSLPDIKAAADAHPDIVELQRGLERIAAACDEYNVALVANERQPQTDEVIVRRVIHLHSAGKASECVDLAVERLPQCDSETELLPLAVSVSISAADIIVRSGDAETLLELLEKRTEWAPYKAVLSFVRKRNSNVLSAKHALTEFKADYEAHDHDPVIGMQLLAHLDTTEEDDAEYCLEVARRLGEYQLLPDELRFVVAQALTTLSRWDQLLELADATLKQYPGLARMRSIRAVALDKLGNTPEALKELTLLIGTGERLAIDVYVRIVTRLGEVDKATRLVEQLITAEPKRQRQFQLVHLLFQLVQSSDPGNPRLADIGWRMGTLARREEEMEEGVFLLSMFASNIVGGVKLDEQRVEEVRTRITAFSELFPTSTLFRMGTVSEDNVLDDVKRLIEAFDPDSDERQEWQRTTERKMERGELPVPYSWRPSQILGYVGNVFELWVYTKRAKRDKQQLRLNMLVGPWQPGGQASRLPLLDVTALLVLHDLGLFETLFAVFPKVAISQQTLRLLQKHSASAFAGLGSRNAKSIQAQLRTFSERILQPEGNLPSDTDRELSTFGFDVKRLMETGKYTLYADDGIYAIYAEALEAGSRICTLDLMEMAVEQGLMSLREMAESISKMCQWNVDVAITDAVFVAALPIGLDKVSSAAEGAEMIQVDAVIAPILESIWSVRKSYEEIHVHMASVLQPIATEARNPETSVASLVLVWLWKAMLRTDIDLSTLRRLAMLFVNVIAGAEKNEVLSWRLRSIYLRVVEGYFGANMDERREVEAIRELAATAAQYDANAKPKLEPSVGNRFAMAWTDGTSDRDKFQTAYNEATIELAKKGGEAQKA